MKSLSEICQSLHNKQTSSEEICQHYLARIAALNPDINAFITVTDEQARHTAADADHNIARGNTTALTGAPIAHKDVFCTAGVLSSCASRMLADFKSPYDAHVVSQLKNAGTVMLGKTNMDEFAMGSSTENSYYGACRNPWNLQHVPGGSSGGSAAAVAAGMIPAATGSDTGGSVRQPAAYCGITGIKPTYGTVSRYGMIAYASSLDQAGALAHSAADCALMLDAMSGFDERDATSVKRPAMALAAKLKEAPTNINAPLRGLRVGLPKEFFGAGLNDQVATRVREASELYRRLGAEIINVSLANAELAIPAYYVIAPAEASSNLSRFDGVRFGYRAEQYSDLMEMYCKSRAEGFGAEVKRRILVGTYVLSAGYCDAYYLQAQKLRRLIAEDFQRAFSQCDVLLGPTTPDTAFRIGEKLDDPVAMYLGDIYTVAVNLAGLPALSHPCGFDDNKMPVGVQLIGNYFEEKKILQFANYYQMESDFHRQHPQLG